MKRMKCIGSFLLAMVFVLCLIPASALPVWAQDIYGTVYASALPAGSALELYAATTLVMDTDLTVLSIQGNYSLTIEGSGKLTVNGSGNGIDVKSLDCSANLFVQTGWHAIEVSETVYINNTDSFIVGGIYAEGDIEIHSTNATIAGNGNAIFSNGGNITLSGGTFDIGANGIAVAAETGGIYMTGAFTVNSNNDRTIQAARGELVIEGSLKSTSGAQFDPDVHFASRDKISIGAKEGFFFYGTTLEVEGLGGILAGNYYDDTDISITADSVSIITERYYALNGGNIYVDSDNLWIENQGSEENENVPYTFHTIFADGDATLSSENGGIVGENCFYVEGNLTLNGNFVVGADHDSGYAMRSIGRTEVNGNLRVIAENFLCVYAEDGFSFNGSTLKLEGYRGIMVQNGDVNIVADSTEIVVSEDCAIADMTGNDSVCNVYIDSDYLWLQGSKDELHNSGCVDINGNVTIDSDEATIMGNYGIDASGDIVLDGNFVVKGLLQQAIRSESRVEAKGNLSLATEGVYSCLTAQEFMFDGTTLTADGYSGIWGKYTDIHADSVVITTSVGDALDGDEVYVTANYLWAENKATKVDSDWQKRGGTQFGIAANSKLALTVKGGTVIGYDHALAVYDEYDKFEFHYIYVNGHLTAVSQTGAGMYVPQGIAELYDGPIVSVGETYGIDAKDVYFDGGSLRVEGNTGIHAISGVEISGEDVRITARDERRSGIWCENGSVLLSGNIAIETNGWYGINAATDVTFEQGYYSITGPKGNAQAVKLEGILSVHPELQIILPDGGHIKGNVINGAGDSPAMELLMFSSVGTVDILVSTPSDGLYPIYDSSAVYGLPPLCSFESIVWFENGVEMAVGTPFTAGNTYSVEMILSATDGYYFTNGVLAKVNGKTSSMTGTMDNNTKLMVRADMGTCSNAISQVTLSVATPVEGNKPSTSVTDNEKGYGVDSDDVRWMVSTDGVNYTPMAADAKFEGGKYYRMVTEVQTIGKAYSFKITDKNGSTVPDVQATVNGKTAKVEKTYDQDPEKMITVSVDFGMCNDFMIEHIAVVDVVQPVAGQSPTYTANVFGTGYRINTDKNDYTDAYWVGEKWYYVKNGVMWIDVTDGGYDFVYENDVFIAGHEYRCKVYVDAEDGYEFAHDKWYEIQITATVNGNTAEFIGGSSQYAWSQEISCNFICEEPAYTPGDVNNDGKVNVRDIGLMQQWMNGWDVTLNMDAGDVTADGKVNVRDIGLMQQYMNGWDVTLK